MMRYLILILLLCLSSLVWANTDSLKQKPTFFEPVTQPSKARLYSVSGIWAASYGSSLYLLSTYWYNNLQGFRTFNDNKNWLQVDKLGHAHTCYFQGVWGKELLQWAGVKHLPATLIGGSIGFVNQTVIEILDGRSPDFGWSNGDFLANASGTALFIGQELLWKEQRISSKFGYTLQDYSKYNNPLIEEVALNEFGIAGEAFFKDYNAHTYWLSANVASFLPAQNKFPKWINVAVGMGGDQMFHTIDNSNRGIELRRYRSFYLSLDADFTKFKAKTGFGKTMLFLLNTFKLPFPALSVSSTGAVKFVPLAF